MAQAVVAVVPVLAIAMAPVVAPAVVMTRPVPLEAMVFPAALRPDMALAVVVME